MVRTTAQTETTRLDIPETRSLHEEVEYGRRNRRALDETSSKRAVHLAHRSVPATDHLRGRVGDVVCKMALVKGPSTATGSSGFVGHWTGVVQRGGRGIDGDAGGARSRLHALVAVVFTSLAFRVLHRDHSQGAQRIDDGLFRLHDDDVAGGVSVRLLSWRRRARGSCALLR